MTSPQIGLLYRQTDASMPLLDLAHAAEERRFDCIVIGEHTHIPVSRETPFPGTADGSLPDAYPEFPDPYVALAFIAAQTSLRVAVGIALVAQHDPIALAKTIATLDRMSGGRLTLGVGFGWNREELANHGKSFTDRRAIVREHVELMRALWTQTEAEYHGEHASLERSWAWPKPVQPTVPVLLGVQGGERGFEAVVGWGDGWLPGSALSSTCSVSWRWTRSCSTSRPRAGRRSCRFSTVTRKSLPTEATDDNSVPSQLA